MSQNIEIDAFIVGERYSNEEIYRSLGVSNAGGVRVRVEVPSKARRVVVMTSASEAKQHAENPYHDRIEGDVLVYTGAGREGDQLLLGANHRLPQQAEDSFPIYGFKILGSRRDRNLGSKRWQFLGLLEYMRHYLENQVDARNISRSTWMFEFFIHRNPAIVTVSSDSQLAKELLDRSRLSDSANKDDRRVVGDSCGDAPMSAPSSTFESNAIRSRMLSVTPPQFEHLVKRILIRFGFERVVVTKYSQDGGIDVNAYPGAAMWPLGDLLVQTQAKRWLHTVGRREVAELRGSLEPFARGVLVTTSHFTKAAISEANATGKNPITLIDGLRFGSIVHSLGPGVMDSLDPAVN